jgi:hypothetical protein
MKMMKILLLVPFFCLLQLIVFSQQKDTMIIKQNDSVILKTHSKDSLSKKDTVKKKPFDPGKASLYSAIFPGLGQFYNKKYWKIPLAWAAVGIPTYTYFFNRQFYKRARYAITVIADSSQGNANIMAKVFPDYKQGVIDGDLQGMENIRNFYRQNEDYSVLFFLLFYTIQIIDATVDAHLRDFNVSNDLSFNIQPGVLQGSNWGAVTFAFDIHKAKPKPLFDNR